MKVLHLTRDYPPHVRGGLSGAVGGLVGALEGVGIGACVASFDGYRPRRTDGPVEPEHERQGALDVWRVRAPGQLPALGERLEASAPELIHVHDPLLWELGLEVRRRVGCPAVATTHVLQRHQNRLRGLPHDTASGLAEARMMEAADAVIAPSRAARGQLARDYPAHASKVRVCGLGIDARDCAQRDGPPHVVSVGRFGDTKGTLELLRVIARVGASRPEVRFTVAGGMPENGKAERRWLARAEALWSPELQARVRFAGWLPPEGVNALLREATVFVSTSWYESFGLAVLEAMASGVAVVAFRVGGLEELLGDGERGLLCDARDADALADELGALLDTPARKAELGDAARDYALRHCSWENAAAQVMHVYRDVALGQATRPRTPPGS